MNKKLRRSQATSIVDNHTKHIRLSDNGSVDAKPTTAVTQKLLKIFKQNDKQQVSITTRPTHHLRSQNASLDGFLPTDRQKLKLKSTFGSRRTSYHAQ